MNNNALAYSFHLGSDKNKKSSIRSKAKTNTSGPTYYLIMQFKMLNKWEKLIIII